jgi:hypothetical protein
MPAATGVDGLIRNDCSNGVMMGNSMLVAMVDGGGRDAQGFDEAV